MGRLVRKRVGKELESRVQRSRGETATRAETGGEEEGSHSSRKSGKKNHKFKRSNKYKHAVPSASSCVTEFFAAVHAWKLSLVILDYLT